MPYFGLSEQDAHLFAEFGSAFQGGVIESQASWSVLKGVEEADKTWRHQDFTHDKHVLVEGISRNVASYLDVVQNKICNVMQCRSIPQGVWCMILTTQEQEINHYSAHLCAKLLESIGCRLLFYLIDQARLEQNIMVVTLTFHLFEPGKKTMTMTNLKELSKVSI